MIPKGYVSRKDFFNLTNAEASAFVIFELKELDRHKDDIEKIREDVKIVSEIHGIGAKNG